MKFISLFFILLFFIPILSAASSSKSGAQFLSLNSTSKAEALSGAVTGKGEEISYLQQNPASVARLKKSETLFSQGFLFEGARVSYLAHGQPFRWGVAHLETLSLNYGKFDRTNEKRETVGTQSPNDLYIGIGWSPNEKILHYENLSLGVSCRYIRSDLSLRQAQTFALNLGAIYKTHWEGVRLGASLNNWGPPLKFERDSPLPRAFRLGTVYETELPLLSSNLSYSLDATMVNNLKPVLSAGVELNLHKILNFQLGYSGEEGQENKLRYGFGLGINSLEVHYAASPFTSLGTRHSVSVKFRFGSDIFGLFSWAVKDKNKSGEEFFLTESQEVFGVPIVNKKVKETVILAKPVPAQNLKVKRQNPELHPIYERACHFMSQRELDKAIKIFRKVYSINKYFLDSAQKLVTCLEGRGVQFYSNRQYELALRDIEEGLSVDPKNPRLKEFLKDIEAMLKTSGMGGE